VLPGHVGALDRRQCARAQPYVRSIVDGHAQVHVIASNSHGATGEAMAKATRDMPLMWHALDRESCARAQCA
jgi:uracil phosphoribosyltransferase